MSYEWCEQRSKQSKKKAKFMFLTVFSKRSEADGFPRIVFLFTNLKYISEQNLPSFPHIGNLIFLIAHCMAV